MRILYKVTHLATLCPVYIPCFALQFVVLSLLHFAFCEQTYEPYKKPRILLERFSAALSVQVSITDTLVGGMFPRSLDTVSKQYADVGSQFHHAVFDSTGFDVSDPTQVKHTYALCVKMRRGSTSSLSWL